MNTNLTTAQLFDQLNRFRATNGKTPLKSFKESRAKLEIAVSNEGAAATTAFEAPLSEIAKQTPRNDVTSIVTPATPNADANVSITTHAGTSNPEKTATLRAARKTNEAKDASLAKLEAQSPSPSAARIANATRVAKAEKEVKRLLKAPIVTKPVKSDRAGFSAAQIIEDFGINAKVGRALLRKHGIAKTPEAIRKFFQDRKSK